MSFWMQRGNGPFVHRVVEIVEQAKFGSPCQSSRNITQFTIARLTCDKLAALCLVPSVQQLPAQCRVTCSLNRRVVS